MRASQVLVVQQKTKTKTVERVSKIYRDNLNSRKESISNPRLNRLPLLRSRLFLPFAVRDEEH